MNAFQDNIALGRPNQWRCRAGGRYLYICEDGLVHYCSQQRGYPGIPLEKYTVSDLRRSCHREIVRAALYGLMRTPSVDPGCMASPSASRHPLRTGARASADQVAVANSQYPKPSGMKYLSRLVLLYSCK